MDFNPQKKLVAGLLFFILVFTGATVFSADENRPQSLAKNQITLQEGPIVENNYKWHRVGNFWHRVTNYGMSGDDAYEDRSPSGDYPGGSGNSYLYRGSVWISGFIDGTFHSTKVEDTEWSPLDSVHVYTGPDAVSDYDIWTRYYDVKTPLAPGHVPLGVEITERSYSWSASYAADFIIYEYTIKNVGVDSDDDGYPDTPRGIDDLYFSFRLDGDVSKLPTWDAEYRFSNQDDLVMANGVPWKDWMDKVPQLAGYDSLLANAPIDSSIVFMFDADNPDYDADNGEPDDFANPGPDGNLQTPGFLGYRILKTDPVIPKHSFHQFNIYNDPGTDQETWDRMLSDDTWENILLVNDEVFPYDYRGLITYGPLDTLAPGDSLLITAALGVGSDPDSGRAYSLADMMQDMDVAQFLVDNDYDISAEALSPGAPAVNVSEYIEDKVTTKITIEWDNSAVTHPQFQSYVVSKGKKTATGAIEWETLATFTDTAGSSTWPPPSSDNEGYYQYNDSDVTNGLVYYYTVQTLTKNIQYPIPFGVIESNKTDEKSFRVISPANAEATETLDRVKAVPNPYIGSASWNNRTPSSNTPWQHRLQFTNLPGDAFIKIFTLDGDYVARVEANKSVISGEDFDISNPSVAEWDLMTRNDQEAAPGIYIYVVESPSLGTKTGKFVIVR